ICDRFDEGLLVLKDGLPVYANRSLAALTGLSENQLLSNPPHSYLEMDLSPDERRSHYEAQTSDVVDTESRLRKADGTRVHVAISGQWIPVDSGFGEFLIIREITERKRIEQALLKARQLESIAALSGGIAHDYNNLLTAIMGNISLCLTSLDSDSPQHDWLTQAQDAALIAKELTNRLITFSRGGTPQKETVDPAGLVEDAAEFALSGSNIEAHFDLPDDLWYMDVDRMQVGQAVHNIVINAREAMPAGGKLLVTAWNEVATKKSNGPAPGPYVVISIQDCGQGIPPEIMNRIFDPYFTTKEMGEDRGMGLGLSIANSIIEKHGGAIGVSSGAGKGARFSIYIPASQNISAPTRKEETGPMVMNGTRTGRILVMDDEEMIRNLTGNILSRLGYEPAFARHGDEAIAQYRDALAKGKPFDAVILDLTVKGGLGGKETIQQLLAIDPAVRGIVSSGYANDPGITNYRDYGFCAVVAKPYRIKEISDQLEQVLGRRQPDTAGHAEIVD
ncbi:MAG: response regulator, partial [Desulfosarcina sp.]|nr:response regulator [Desulfobacterales bacterium]